MPDDFRAYRGVTPPGGVMSVLPEAEPPAPEPSNPDDFRDQPYPFTQSELDYIKGEQEKLRARIREEANSFRAPAPGPSAWDQTKTAASNIFHGMSLFNLVPAALKAAYSGVTLPGDAATGKAPPMYLENGEINPALIERSMDFAGLVTLGAGAVPAEANSLRTGIKAIPEKAPGLSTTTIPTPLKTRADGMYSKAELEALRFKQPKTTAKEFIAFLKGKGVKKAEIEALGLDKLDPNEVRPTDDFRAVIVDRTPKLERVELTRSDTRHSQFVEEGGPKGEYREIVYKLPDKYTAKAGAGPMPTRDEVYASMRDELAQDIELARRERANTDRAIPDDWTVDSPHLQAGLNRLVDQAMERLRKEHEAGIFSVPSHWGDMENPMLHLRVTDVTQGNRKIFKLEELQSDWGQQKRMTADGTMSYRKNVPDAPWVMDDSWIDLGVKKAIVEAVESGADEIELVPGIVHSERWQGQPGLIDFYDKKLPGAFDRAAKEAGAELGKKTEEELPLSPKQVESRFDDLRSDEIYDRFGVDTERERDLWDEAKYTVRSELENPGFVKTLREELTDRMARADMTLAATRKRYQALRSKLDDGWKPDEQMTDMDRAERFVLERDLREASQDIAQDMRLVNNLRTQHRMLHDIVPQMLNEVEQTKNAKVPRYRLEITPELREFVKNQGFRNFAKGGIVDVANYLAWSR